MLTIKDFISDGIHEECSWIANFEKYSKRYTTEIFKHTVFCYAKTPKFIILDTLYTLKDFRGRGEVIKIIRNLQKHDDVLGFCSDRLLNFYIKVGFIPFSNSTQPFNYILLKKSCV